MVILSRRFAFAGAAGLMGSLAVRSAGAQSMSSSDDALAILTADPKFSDWVQILQYAGLSQYAASNPPFTAFVPTNEAFKKVPAVLAEALQGKSRPFPDTTRQVNFVRSHVIRDMHPLTESSGKTTTYTSLAGNQITVDGTHTGYFLVSWIGINQTVVTARISAPPIQASNALLYAYDNPVPA